MRAFELALLLTPPGRQPEVRAGEPYLEGRLTAGEVREYGKREEGRVQIFFFRGSAGRTSRESKGTNREEAEVGLAR